MPGDFKAPLFNIKREESKPGAPYDPYLENVIAPACSTRVRPAIIRKFCVSSSYPPLPPLSHLIS